MNAETERLITKFAVARLDKANDKFAEIHGYDLRKTDNSDYLMYQSYRIDGDDILVLKYVEVTSHEVPYSVVLLYDLNNPEIDWIFTHESKNIKKRAALHYLMKLEKAINDCNEILDGMDSYVKSLNITDGDFEGDSELQAMATSVELAMDRLASKF